ncbi:tellurite resistance protein TehB [compost metagenome]
MSERISRIRDEERKYHETCYDQHKLYEAGSWLSKPVKTVVDTLARFEGRDHLTVLDLGCGVGRNSIPIAQFVKARQGKVVCVDLIESAITKLQEYSEIYAVSECIETRVSDIAQFEIPTQTYDYIVAVSTLEHLVSQQQFIEVLDRMATGTKYDGINCIILNTNIHEIDVLTGAELEPQIELNMTTPQAEEALHTVYNGWEVIYTILKKLTFNIERNGQEIWLKSDCLTYVIQRN